MTAPPSPRAVVVMGKVPRPGLVKTRLARAVPDDVAARLYRAFLTDVFTLVERARALVPGGFAPVFACALGPADRLDDAAALAPAAWRVIAQRGAGLGERIEACFEDARGDVVVVLGSDSPALDPARIAEAFARLELGGPERRAVVGPTADGGYYLVGAAGRVSELFERVPWSTAEVLAVTRARAGAAGIALDELEPAYDVDEPEDLRVLHDDLARGASAPATRVALDAEPAVVALLGRDVAGEAR
ncbi:TIGR04282 family arsenosugar biosynthesis glycosyltransferase [Myxococcota bacterium]|nr:TIGR04282 family arsenosugar biosynthesis glycosyltransferase [Myxococcota bacterium]